MLWVAGITILALIVMIPIYAHAREFPFYLDNFIFVFALFTYARFMFFVSTSILTLHVGVKLFFWLQPFHFRFCCLINSIISEHILTITAHNHFLGTCRINYKSLSIST